MTMGAARDTASERLPHGTSAAERRVGDESARPNFYRTNNHGDQQRRVIPRLRVQRGRRPSVVAVAKGDSLPRSARWREHGLIGLEIAPEGGDTALDSNLLQGRAGLPSREGFKAAKRRGRRETAAPGTENPWLRVESSNTVYKTRRTRAAATTATKVETLRKVATVQPGTRASRIGQENENTKG